MSNPPALLSLDFDGTMVLEGQSPEFSPALREALQNWTSSGGLWLINSGRSLPHLLEGLAGVAPDLRPDFLVTREHEIHFPNAFGRWIDLGDWNYQAAKAHRKLFRRHRRFFKQVERHLEEHTLASFIRLESDPAAIVASTEAEMDAIASFLDPHLVEREDLGYERNTIYLRFCHRNYTKGSALAHIAQHLGTPSSIVHAVGDNHNDMSMLKPSVAGKLACPANSVAEVKSAVAAAGGHVSDRAGSEGTADAIRHWLGGMLCDGVEFGSEDRACQVPQKSDGRS